jgi:hypothetical protein
VVITVDSIALLVTSPLATYCPCLTTQHNANVNVCCNEAFGLYIKDPVVRSAAFVVLLFVMCSARLVSCTLLNARLEQIHQRASNGKHSSYSTNHGCSLIPRQVQPGVGTLLVIPRKYHSSRCRQFGRHVHAQYQQCKLLSFLPLSMCSCSSWIWSFALRVALASGQSRRKRPRHNTTHTISFTYPHPLFDLPVFAPSTSTLVIYPLFFGQRVGEVVLPSLVCFWIAPHAFLPVFKLRVEHIDYRSLATRKNLQIAS